MASELSTKRWICENCSYVYHEDRGDPVTGIAPGTPFEDIPDDMECAACGGPKSAYRELAPDEAVDPAH